MSSVRTATPPATQEAELVALRKYAHEATKAITGLTSNGSEFFGKKIGDIYTADLEFCCSRIRETRERQHNLIVEGAKTIARLREVVAELEASLAEAKS